MQILLHKCWEPGKNSIYFETELKNLTNIVGNNIIFVTIINQNEETQVKSFFSVNCHSYVTEISGLDFSESEIFQSEL